MKRILSVLLACAFLLCGCSNENTAVNDTKKPSAAAGSEGLEIHFIDVGQADSALVMCDGETMLIDGGNVSDSSLIYSYLDKHSVDILDYVVLSHAHEDHVGGLPGAFRHSDVGRVFAPETESDSECYLDFKEAVKEQGLAIEPPDIGETFNLGGSTVEILGPVENTPEELNNTSIVLKITYGGVSVLFSGDAEYDAEKLVLGTGCDLKSTVLKAPHHGSDTSSCYEFLREVMPEYIVISVGNNNSYGHPHDEVLSRYDALGAKVLRTDKNGTVIMKTDGREVEFSCEKEGAKEESTQKKSEGETSGEYIGNINSKVYHNPSCSALPKEKNRIYFGSEEDAVAEEYRPCGNCMR